MTVLRSLALVFLALAIVASGAVAQDSVEAKSTIEVKKVEKKACESDCEKSCGSDGEKKDCGSCDKKASCGSSAEMLGGPKGAELKKVLAELTAQVDKLEAEAAALRAENKLQLAKELEVKMTALKEHVDLVKSLSTNVKAGTFRVVSGDVKVAGTIQLEKGGKCGKAGVCSEQRKKTGECDGTCKKACCGTCDKAAACAGKCDKKKCDGKCPVTGKRGGKCPKTGKTACCGTCDKAAACAGKCDKKKCGGKMVVIEKAVPAPRRMVKVAKPKAGMAMRRPAVGTFVAPHPAHAMGPMNREIAMMTAKLHEVRAAAQQALAAGAYDKAAHMAKMAHEISTKLAHMRGGRQGAAHLERRLAAVEARLARIEAMLHKIMKSLDH